MVTIDRLRENAKTIQTVIATFAILGLILTLLLGNYPNLPAEIIFYELNMFAIILVFMLYVMEEFSGEYASFKLTYKNNSYMIFVSICFALTLIYPIVSFCKSFGTTKIFGIEKETRTNDVIRVFYILGYNGIFLIITLLINASITFAIMFKELKHSTLQT